MTNLWGSARACGNPFAPTVRIKPRCSSKSGKNLRAHANRYPCDHAAAASKVCGRSVAPVRVRADLPANTPAPPQTRARARRCPHACVDKNSCAWLLTRMLACVRVRVLAFVAVRACAC
eukprot:2978034-Pleurochrysis_carterae.AAC.1